MRKLAAFLFASLLLASCRDKNTQIETIPAEEPPVLGFFTEDFMHEEHTVKNGDNFTGILTKLGMSASDAFAMAEVCDTVFDVRKVRAGAKLDAYYLHGADSTSHGSLRYLVYNRDLVHCTVFQCSDSLALWNVEKPVDITSKSADITINSSLWNDMKAVDAPVELILELSEIYAWTVDFFGLQKEDRFRVLYNEKSCEGQFVGVEGIDFAIFSRGEKNEYAIRFDQGDGGNQYWNDKGESMKKAFLKAPLKFTRISSTFSYNRKHPVTGEVKAHTAVDYAAPTGTPVMALGDGTVISVGWAGGGGNTVKIRHNSVYTTSYMHLSKYGSGIKNGVRVRQGDVIGYVGATGTATGPHLDFRVYKNGTPINPLTLESPSAEPIKDENKAALDSLLNHYVSMPAFAAADSLGTAK